MHSPIVNRHVHPLKARVIIHGDRHVTCTDFAPAIDVGILAQVNPNYTFVFIGCDEMVRCMVVATDGIGSAVRSTFEVRQVKAGVVNGVDHESSVNAGAVVKTLTFLGAGECAAMS